MRLEMCGKRIERVFDLRFMAMSRRRAAEPFDPRAALVVIGEEAMHISSRHAAAG